MISLNYINMLTVHNTVCTYMLWNYSVYKSERVNYIYWFSIERWMKMDVEWRGEMEELVTAYFSNYLSIL
jgi:hypothetical protein